MTNKNYSKGIVNINKTDDTLNQFDGYSNNEVENKSSIEVVGSGNFQKIFTMYHDFLMRKDDDIFFPFSDIKDIPQLTIEEISRFLPLTVGFESCNLYFQRTSEFINTVVENSYDNHNLNNFYFNLEGCKPFNNLCSGFLANEKNTLKITLDGDVGSGFANNSEYLDVTINGDVDFDFGLGSNFLKCEISGDVGEYFGFKSVFLDAIVYGKFKGPLLDNFYNFKGAKFDFRDESTLEQVLGSIWLNSKVQTNIGRLFWFIYKDISYNEIITRDDKGRKKTLLRFKDRIV